MAFRPIVVDSKLVGSNAKTGLYQVLVKLRDGSQCRVFYNNKEATVNRLQTTPCPICRRDYYCNCLDKFTDQITSQIDLEGLIAADTAQTK
ncbi:hypothetical protein [Paenibacillus beijingensis]|uniref:Uncharacterized protein n=1 Tax=Paenibacillus beijingensis TaxID=1126833 RepID=A0A0D5NMA7_9BACL|nr:hypothetical protein [Paenibacillus beijingensis]AJY76401.1 hypothetical protein VN24_19800 [Paenibacillus beijingensis]